MSADHCMRPLLAEAKEALDAFMASNLPFRVVKAVPSQSSSQLEPKTIFILDSSFNPPSAAHLKLATTALMSSRTRYPRPCRLLLLFSTHNADKSPSPAAFEHRLALMILLAEDLYSRIDGTTESANESHKEMGIDVCLTNKPYYADKSVAIQQFGPYGSTSKHIHLVGFDTFTRILNPKYYKDSKPPLSALDPFFDRHGLQVTMRPGDDWGDANEQTRYFERLKAGDIGEDGARKEWADKIEVVESSDEADVSSTKARKAAKDEDWTQMDRLCPTSIARWIREEGLYQDDAEYAATI